MSRATMSLDLDPADLNLHVASGQYAFIFGNQRIVMETCVCPDCPNSTILIHDKKILSLRKLSTLNFESDIDGRARKFVGIGVSSFEKFGFLSRSKVMP